MAAPSVPAWPAMVDAAFLQDPYPAYRALGEAGPIQWSDEFFGGAWLLNRHDDVEAALRDPRLSAQRTGGWVGDAAGAPGEMADFQRLFARAMLFVDAPDHTRLRQAMAAGFKPAVLQALAPRIARWTEARLDAVDAVAGFDFMEAFARPLPAQVIAALMGVEEGEQAAFIAHSHHLAEFIGAPRPSHGQARQAQRALLGLSRYFEAALARRRSYSDSENENEGEGDDMIARLAAAERAGRIHGSAELLAQCAMLLFAGHETTRNLLGNGLRALLDHPGQWRRLQQDPALLPGAVRELLRFDSPVQYTGRRVATDFMLHGRQLRRGDLVIALIGAANRDPSRYTDPERLDVGRRQGPSMAFGYGPHVCIGASLTLLEAETVFAALLRRWPHLQLREDAPRWNANPVYRGLESLRVGVKPDISPTAGQ